jgi:hypothetical protein
MRKDFELASLLLDHQSTIRAALMVQLKRLQEDKSHWDELTVSHGPIPLYLILRVNDEIAALKKLIEALS